MRDGNFRRRLTVPGDGLVAEIAAVFNEVAERNQHLTGELSRVRRAVGREGRLTARLESGAGEGAWASAVDNCNALIDDLARPMAEVGRVLSSIAEGDLDQRMELRSTLPDGGSQPLRGEFLKVGRTVNSLVDQLSEFTDEVTRVAIEVGTEGKLGGQARVRSMSGSWKDLADSVNTMAGRLTAQVRNIAEVTTAVAKGDLSRKVTVDVAGEMLELKNTVNTMVDQLNSFAAQVTRVAREVGTEGRLGGQAQVPGVAGVWRDLTDSVNFMANNLTDQVRNIAQVTTAVARGDLSQKIQVDARGEILELKNTINTMVDQLSAFAAQVTRVARDVGTEGRLGGQAQVPGVAGVWRDLTDSVNFMANNLTDQVRNIAQVTTAVARGDLSQKIQVDARGEILELKNTINTMVDQLGSFADEVTRVARDVGTEGILGGQATVPGVSGTWKDLTNSVNFMASNLTSQVRNIAEVTTAVAKGDVSKKITVDARGEILELVTTVNTMVDQLSAFADEVTRVAREVGTEGILGGQARVRGVSGIWKDLTDNVNFMASNLTSQVRNIAEVATAVARGDLSKKITIEAQGEVAALAGTLNTMVDQLSAFAVQVTRVAREVGTDGILGGQADVPGVAGIWKDLTDNVNQMANNLTGQVRNIALVITAVARGDLSQKIDVDARGEILELKTSINTMVDQLSSFADEVTRVAREVGTDGRLGGIARVPGVDGTWQDLTESVNELANNLTRQVRAIAQVATAVTRGDLSLRIDVDASGEIDELKDNINQMIANLRETTRTNQEQDWHKTNIARFSGLLQGRRDLEAVASLIMSELTPAVSAQHGAFFLAQPAGRSSEMVTEDDDEADTVLRLIGSYGYQRRSMPTTFRPGESLVGQAAIEKRPISLTEAPPGYLRISSALGESQPAHVVVLPVLFEGRLLGVIELATFSSFTSVVMDFLTQVADLIGVTVNTISVNTKTEGLLLESQRLTAELSMRSAELEARQEELERTNEELQEKAEQLAQQNRDIEIKNSAIEEARRVLEERAEQLAQANRYKSEFLANMSHELRTPLNSLLILAKLLSDNNEGNLSSKQVEFADTIHGAGSDLLQLINDILDLSKVEAGKMDVRPARIALVQLTDYVEAAFRPLTAEKGLEFTVNVSPDLPATLHTDEQRLQQVLRNLLSNAVKFTEAGTVRLEIGPAGPVVPQHIREQLLESGRIDDPDAPLVAFSVTDTGIGIPDDKLREIFEAFKQADGTTSRKYGGTGLGLSISRELARLLGGEIHAQSEFGRGSTFTLYLPLLQDVPETAAERGLPAGGQLRAPAGVSPTGEPAPVGEAVFDEKNPAEQWAQEVRELAMERRRGAAERRRAAAEQPGSVAPPQPAEQADRPRQSDSATANRVEDLPAPRTGSGPGFEGRFDGEEVLIVDDDVRNVFALTSVLEQYGLTVLYAENGREGIEVLEQHENISLVLMDIMMPEMDGYATTEAIRRMPQFAGLPIIALTAKAMKGDKEKSIEAGATDHVTKPVDTDHLLGVMRHWLGARG
ncbi:HAMP domain-containing protein [Kitasatospora sp. RB6PN24]|uniref:HAMP domain-containing protein n=1 Tax=Kitasatospora humi TaxID=2893891 RepID=UPI001E38ACC5|nr:HAMP domain-containing protein [Kitasatospora humi]MCC9309174.1 HAMP domain-containing protein [Kitasatospora humi]